jgi:WD40 repeat protein/tRNA A-37 threonylcarbamoyl transferase component Bud32
MAEGHPDQDKIDEDMERFLLQFFESADRGGRVDPQELIANRPELTARVSEFLAAYAGMEGLAAPLRWVARVTDASPLRAGDTSEVGVEATTIAAEPDVGQTIGSYELLARIDRGGMGIVYKARQQYPNRIVALKMVRASRLGDEATRRRFRKEAETAAALDHPNIVPLYEVGESNGRLFFSMKLLEGGSLKARLREFTANPNETARLMAAVARAVSYAHGRAVLHRDLKPSNILLDGEGRPHVADFGLAKRIDDDGEPTQAGMVLGTPSYMAPEQTTEGVVCVEAGGAGTARVVTEATDVYGLGAVLYALLTGRPPFVGSTVYDTMEQVRHAAPTSPRSLNPRVDRDLETVCLKSLEKCPRNRYAAADDLADDLERWLQGKPIEARRPGGMRRVWLWARRHKGWAALAVAIAVFLPTVLAILATSIVVVNSARALAEDRESETRRQLYAADMASAYRNWLNGDITGLCRTLDQWKPAAGGESPDFGWRLLDALRSGLDITAPSADRAHDGAVYHLTLSPDGRTLASASKDGTVRLRTADQPPRYLRGHKGEVNWVAFDRDGRRLATAGDDGTVRLWDAATGRQVLELNPGAGEAYAAEFTPDAQSLVTGWHDGTWRQWSLPSGNPFRVVKAHEKRIESLAVRPDGAQIVTAGGDGLMKVWHLDSGDLHYHRDLNGPASSICYSPSGNLLAVGDSEGSIRVYDIWSRQWGIFQADDGGRVEGLAFSGDDRTLVSCGGNGWVRFWDVNNRTLRHRFRCGEARTWSLTFVGSQMLCGDDEGVIRAWDFDAARIPRCLNARGCRGSFAFSPDSRTLAVLGSDSTLSLRDPFTGLERSGTSNLRSLERDDSKVSFTSDGRELVIAGPDGSLSRVVPGSPSRLVERLPGPRMPAGLKKGDHLNPQSICQRPGSDEWDICVPPLAMVRWERSAGRQLPPFIGEKSCLCATWSPDGTTLAAVVDSRACLLHPDTGEMLPLEEPGPQRHPEAVVFSPDGHDVAIGGSAEGICVRSTADGRLKFRLMGHRAVVTSLAYSPDGKILVSGSGNGMVKVWHIASRRELFSLTVAADCVVNDVAFSPNGEFLAAAYTSHRENGVAVWRATP